MTGLFDDKATYDKFEKAVRGVEGVKKLYWHVAYLSEADQKARKPPLLAWHDVLTMVTKAEARLIGTAGVADVNFRIAGDSFGTLFLIGRARSAEEEKQALARARDGDGVKKVVDLVEVRP